MGPHGICMRFVFRNMLTLSLSLSIGVAEATPRRWSNGVPRLVPDFSSGEILQFALSVFTRRLILCALPPLRNRSRQRENIRENGIVLYELALNFCICTSFI